MTLNLMLKALSLISLTLKGVKHFTLGSLLASPFYSVDVLLYKLGVRVEQEYDAQEALGDFDSGDQFAVALNLCSSMRV